MDIKELVKQIAELTTRVEALESKLAASQRDRGPKSERTMTEADAHRVKFGDLKDAKPKVAAEALNLSYGQIFSCRGGYTFKQVKSDWKPKAAAPEAQPEAQKQ